MRKSIMKNAWKIFNRKNTQRAIYKDADWGTFTFSMALKKAWKAYKENSYLQTLDFAAL